MKKIKLAVIFGGKSGEHEVSLASVKSVFAALDKEKYEVVPVAITKKGTWLFGEEGMKYFESNVDSIKKKIGVGKEDRQGESSDEKEGEMDGFFKFCENKKDVDLVLPILHGPFGEDGKLQGLLDVLGIPYVFSGTLANALAMNKPKAKVIVRDAGLDVAKSLVLKKGDELNIEKVTEQMSFPIVVKPSELGSSVGMTLAENKEELEKGIANAFECSCEIMLEEYIKGRELTVAVMGKRSDSKALPVIEIIPQESSWFDYNAKYKPGATKEICPAEISDDIRDEVQEMAIKAFEIIGCEDLARADFIWDEKSNKIYFLEINTIPGMTETSLAPQAAKAEGMNFSQFLDKLIERKI